MPKIQLIAFFLGFASVLSAQHTVLDPKFPRSALEADLSFIRDQIFHAHANPFTEIDSLTYIKAFELVRAGLRDSMTPVEFARLAKPLMAPLSDEHARLGVPLDNSALGTAKAFLPFTLKKVGNRYVVKQLLAANDQLEPGDEILSIQGVPAAEIVQRCSNYTTGFPGQRLEKAMSQLGLLYLFAFSDSPRFSVVTNLRTVSVEATNFETWRNYLKNQQAANSCNDLIQYRLYGKVAYIDFCSFSVGNDSMFAVLENRMADIFKQIKQDKAATLVIDVSNNSGGNSQCGDLIINYFHAKPYYGYNCKWKRSDEYLNLIRKWGIKNDFYERQPVGSVLSFNSEVHRPSKRLKNRFKGPTYVVTGPGTFSSAIMFATIVKDNHLATLVGEVPENGHPNHFGEMYYAKAPNTGLDIQFGVKNWIRPSGVLTDNVLRPDKEIPLGQDNKVERIVKGIGL